MDPTIKQYTILKNNILFSAAALSVVAPDAEEDIFEE